MNRYFNKIFCLIIIILFLFMIFVVDGYIESSHINKEIKDFKERGELVYQTDNTNYFQVLKKYDYEDTKNVIRDYENINIGTTGDIYISDRDPAHNFFITKWMSKQTWIGHLGLVFDQDATKTVEIVGNKTIKENVVRIYNNNWMNVSSPRYLVMRVKDINNTQKERLIEAANNVLGCGYNYTFIFQNNKKFYCSNLITHIYKKIGIELNEDHFLTTGSDIITNEQTYIIYYKETIIKQGKKLYNVYFLKEE